MLNTSKLLREKLLMASVAGVFALSPLAATAVLAQSNTTAPTADRIVEEPAEETDATTPDAGTEMDSTVDPDSSSDSTAGSGTAPATPDAAASDNATDEPDSAAGGSTVPGAELDDDTAASDDMVTDEDDSVAGEQPAIDSETTSALPADDASGMTGLFLQEQDEDHVLANNYIGKSVYNEAGEKVGEINDLVFTKDGGIEAAIVGVGGFLGIGQHNVAVDFSQINIVEDAENAEIELTIAADRDQLAEAPAFQTKEDRLAEADRQDTSAPASSPLVPGGTTSE